MRHNAPGRWWRRLVAAIAPDEPEMSPAAASTFGASGIAPDSSTAPGMDEAVRITCVDYSPEQVEWQEIADLPSFLARHRPAWSHVRWINVEGLAKPDVIRSLAEKYEIHPLAVEDVLHNVQRPKAEDYPGSGDHPGRLFVVARAIAADGVELRSEQVSIFLGRTTLLSFQERPGTIFASIRPRIETRGSRLRENDVSFLFYALVDGIVDGYFPVLERYSERLQNLDEEMLEQPDRATWHKVQVVKRELLLLRRAAWPTRDLIAELLRERHECLSETTRTYFRDVYDHCVQILDLVEGYREITTALSETYMSAISNRMNEIMKVLTVISTIFIPLSFLAGVYGMNMRVPENEWPGMYPVFWLICLAVAGSMLSWLKYRRWL